MTFLRLIPIVMTALFAGCSMSARIDMSAPYADLPSIRIMHEQLDSFLLSKGFSHYRDHKRLEYLKNLGPVDNADLVDIWEHGHRGDYLVVEYRHGPQSAYLVVKGSSSQEDRIVEMAAKLREVLQTTFPGVELEVITWKYLDTTCHDTQHSVRLT